MSVVEPRSVDPDLAPLLERFGRPPLPASAEEARSPSAVLEPLKGPSEEVKLVRGLVIDAVEVPQMRARLYVPDSEPSPLVVFLHGGGWVLGGLDLQDGLCRSLANRFGAPVLAVDYRLAPEHPFPAAVDDARAAYRWALEHRAELEGVAADRGVVVVGDSAGGNLAVQVARSARDDGLHRPELCVLLCPVTSHRLDDGSFDDFGDGYFLTRDRMAWYWDQYVPAGVDRTHPDLSPLSAELAGLAPMVVVTAGCDPLRDQGLDFARACVLAGVETTVLHHPGVIHGFLSLQAASGRARRALDELGAIVARRLRDHDG
jgi:acetyl esterase